MGGLDNQAESLAQHPDVLDAVSTLVMVLDPDGRIVYLNRACREATGCTLEEAKGEYVWNLFLSPEDPGSVDTFVQEWEAGRYPKEYTSRLTAGDGECHLIAWVNTILYGETGKIEYVVSTGTDLTAHMQVQEALSTERRQLFSLLDGLPVSVYLQAPDHSLRFANRHFRDLFGDLERRRCYELLRDGNKPCVDCPTFRVFESGQPQQWEWTRPNGRIYEVYDYPFQDLNGSPLVLKAFVDITDLRRTEEERQRLQAQTALTESLASLATMSAGIAHEINQPLNALKVTADALLYWYEEKGRPPDEEKVVRSLRRISEQAARIDEIIKHLRTFVRSEQVPKLKPCDFNNAVNGALSILGGQLSSHGIEVIKVLDKSLPKVLGDPSRLEEVIVNLLANAMHALDAVDRAVKEILCRTRRFDGKVVLEISDNATGIRDEIRDKVFDPFFTTKEPGQGMGVGLSLVQAVVTRFGGVIHVSNNEKGGATFTVELPISQN